MMEESKGIIYLFYHNVQDESRLREALKFANACGALTVMERGAIPALPSMKAVREVLLQFA